MVVRALSLVRLKRLAHNELIAGSNPAGPTSGGEAGASCGCGGRLRTRRVERCDSSARCVAGTTTLRRSGGRGYVLSIRFALVRVWWVRDRRGDAAAAGRQLATPSPADSRSYVYGDRVTETTARQPDASWPHPPQPIRESPLATRSSLARAREAAFGDLARRAPRWMVGLRAWAVACVCYRPRASCADAR